MVSECLPSELGDFRAQSSILRTTRTLEIPVVAVEEC